MSYLADRKQKVHIESFFFGIDSQSFGVIQGSKSAPLFFDIYSNDLKCICANNEKIKFADDTCHIYVHENLRTLKSHVNTRLAKILDWCRFNKLSLIPLKSQLMLITTKLVPTSPRVFLGSDEIICKNSVKYLGLNFDINLKFAFTR